MHKWFLYVHVSANLSPSAVSSDSLLVSSLRYRGADTIIPLKNNDDDKDNDQQPQTTVRILAKRR